MTINPFMIYLWGIADNVRLVLNAVATVSIFVTAAAALGTVLAQDDKNIKPATAAIAWRWIRRGLAIAIAAGIGTALAPTSNTVAVMVVAPAIVNSSVIQKDLPELYQAALGALKATLSGKDTEK